MDESFNIPIGCILQRRRSTEESRRSPFSGDEGLSPDDYRDVFGGPPRTVLLGRFSNELSLSGSIRRESIYDEIFQPAGKGMAAAEGGRRLPGFRIPPAVGRNAKREIGFYDDIFASDDGDGMSKSRSMEKCSLKSPEVALSSDELSPARECLDDDAIFSAFASKLRPITIPTRRQNQSPPSTFSTGETSDNHNPPSRSSFTDFFDQGRAAASTHFSYGLSPPEFINLNRSFTKHQASPSSEISSVYPETMRAVGFKAYERHREVDKIVMEVDERCVAESPFVIELDGRCTAEASESAASVDEAIAWAKEKFFSHVTAGPNCREEAQLGHEQVEL